MAEELKPGKETPKMRFFPFFILILINPGHGSFTIFGSGANEWQKALSDYLLLKKVRQGLKEQHVRILRQRQLSIIRISGLVRYLTEST